MIRRDPERRPRAGFTLVELLVVIVIIVILMGLLLPVIVGAVRRTNEARVSAEINTLAMALARFKEAYGEYPPSRVILSETGVYSANNNNSPVPVAADFTTPLAMVPLSSWYGGVAPATFGTADISFGELAQRSRRALQKFFPKAVLQPIPAGGPFTYWPDFNGNAGITTTAPDAGFIYLEGHECLVFFLGGIPSPTANSNGSVTFGASGFARDPMFPFKNAIATTNRTQPMFEFRGDRLVDTDGDGIPGYLDPNASGGTGSYYAYFSTYGAAGYDPNDVNFPELSDGGDSVGTFFRIGFPTAPLTAAPVGLPNTPFSPAPNPYTSSLPTPIVLTTSPPSFSPAQPALYINNNSFQIISAGGDGLFGMGGQFNSSSGFRLPMPPRPGDGPAGPYTLLNSPIPDGLRDRENDNITSFTSGRLN